MTLNDLPLVWPSTPVGQRMAQGAVGGGGGGQERMMTGMAESLWGRINPREMGSRAIRETPAPRQSSALGALPAALSTRRSKQQTARSVLEATGDLANVTYRPKTRETTLAWEYILAFVYQSLGGDQPRDVVASAADEALGILKDDSLRDLDRKERIEALLGSISTDRFAQLVNLGKRITDYSQITSGGMASGGGAGRDIMEDDDAGVAVVFEEEEEQGELDVAAHQEDDEDAEELEASIPIIKLDQSNQITEENLETDLIIGVERTEEKSQTVDESDGPKLIDFESLAFPQGGHTMTNKKCVVSEKSFKVSKAGYEEIHIPAPSAKPMGMEERLVSIESMPDWAQPAFSGMASLNRVQSRLYNCAFHSDENFLLCAPTGAGKTNVALLAILRQLGQHFIPADSNGRDQRGGQIPSIDRDAFKIVYVAPMKALVQEMVGNFSRKLEPYGIMVAELTGDQQLTKAQITQTQVLVTTPEKWDVITRKNSDTSYTRLVRLLIIDEIHLLHDDRGPVVEALVARTLRQAEEMQQWIRLVGLSATLPNYLDVGRFLRVKSAKSGIFFFDASYRPCPLAQQYVGITERKPLKRMQMMNEIVYEKVMERAGRHQLLIFVHSRKDTAKTAKAIRDMAMAKETIGLLLANSAASREVLSSEAEATKNADLKDLLPYGFAIHHAGMARTDRTMVEEMFAEGHIQVLISTATLAWGVNLPAHTVLIKGTQVYSPERGRWEELSAQDVLQMLGRAGRPQYDTQGEGIIITTHAEVQFYLSLMNQQLPIESQLIGKLVDHMNAEIVLGSIRTLEEAARWLGYTYLYVRMRREPTIYGVSPEELQADPNLFRRRLAIAHTAATLLDKANLIRYDRRTGLMRATELARISSHYYISHHSMATYNQHLRPTSDEIDLLRVFALSQEFKLIPVRREEKLELVKLAERVPIPIRENAEEPVAKINILLQAYISQLALEGFALAADMVYVRQSASRILRALFEMCLQRGWASVAHRALDLCKMVDWRMWRSMTPLRQLPDLPVEVVKRVERKDFPWERLFDLNVQELGELVRMPKAGKALHQALRQFPRMALQAQAVPLTRTHLSLEVLLKPDFDWNPSLHGQSEAFWLVVEDVEGERILHFDTFLLHQQYIHDQHRLTLHVPLQDPPAPAYFISVISDRWLHCQTRLSLPLHHLILPDRKTPSTPLEDLPPLSISSAFLRQQQDAGSIEARYHQLGMSELNVMQTQTFPALFRSDENVFVGARTGSGKTMGCAEFAIWRMLIQNAQARCVYMTPHGGEEILSTLAERWRFLFAPFSSADRQIVVQLTGDSSTDFKLLESGTIILCTPSSWDTLSRRWRTRKTVQSVSLFIADDVHELGNGEVGATIEVILSRMRFISAQLEEHGGRIRLVALGMPIWNSKDLAHWLGIPTATTFNFHGVGGGGGIDLTIHLQVFHIRHYASLMVAMSKPAFGAFYEQALMDLKAVKREEESEMIKEGNAQDVQNIDLIDKIDTNAIIFVANRKQAILTAYDLIPIVANAQRRLLKPVMSGSVEDGGLSELLREGLAYYHEGQSKADRQTICKLFSSGALRLLVISRGALWELPDSLRAKVVVVMGTEEFEGREHRYVDYPMVEILQMLGRAGKIVTGEGMVRREMERATAVILCRAVKRNYLAQMLEDPLPLESQLDQHLADHLNSEIASNTIQSKQDAVDYLTWTYFYRRLVHNPNYYNLAETSQLRISSHLSELIEQSLTDLVTARCIQIGDGDTLAALNLGHISAYYGISYATIEMMAMTFKADAKLRSILQVLSAASEFDTLPMRHREEGLLERLYEAVPVRLASAEGIRWNDPHLKVNLLLQAHFSRLSLPAELEADQRHILSRILSLTQAAVDVLSSCGYLSPALAAMDFSQMCVQAMWDHDSPLKQLPHLASDRLKKAQEMGIETIFDLLEADQQTRDRLLEGLDSVQLRRLIAAANRYPAIDVQYGLDSEVSLPGADMVLRAVVRREGDEGEDGKMVEGIKSSGIEPVIAPFYPTRKEEGWWLVIGQPSERLLLGIKRFLMTSPVVTINVPFAAPSTIGACSLKLYLVCDSYLGCDQEFDFALTVEAAMVDASNEAADDKIHK